jgi:hypothetical protein
MRLIASRDTLYSATVTVYSDTLCFGRHGGSLITITKLQTPRIYIILIYICELCILVIRRYILTMKYHLIRDSFASIVIPDQRRPSDRSWVIRMFQSLNYGYVY